MPTAVPLSFRIAWITLGAIWAITALAVKPTVRVERRDSRIGHVVTFAIAFAILFSPGLRRGALAWRLLPAAAPAAVLGPP